LVYYLSLIFASYCYFNLLCLLHIGQITQIVTHSNVNWQYGIIDLVSRLEWPKKVKYSQLVRTTNLTIISFDRLSKLLQWLNTNIVGSTNTIDICLIFSTIYIFIPVSDNIFYHLHFYICAVYFLSLFLTLIAIIATATLTHVHTGQFSGGPRSIGPPANMCTCCVLHVFKCLN
jgi:hypothetical protein